MVVLPPGVKFPLVHTTLTLGPGQSGTVYDLRVPPGWVAFVERVANVYYEDTWYEFRVDGKQVGGKIDYVLGHINDPLVYDPPILARKQVLWVGHNGGDETQVFEVLTDGIMFPDVATLSDAERAAKAAVASLTPEQLEALKALLRSA